MNVLHLASLGAETVYIFTKTFVRHFLQRKDVVAESEARKDISYDEAFNIVGSTLYLE